MDAITFLKEHIRMCESMKDCQSCPFILQDSELCIWDCLESSSRRAEEAISIIEKWSKENPLEE